MWLPGLKSDMASTKASEVARWARTKGLACARFDYSGHGRSGGRFEDGTIGRWLEEAEAVFARLTHGPVILVGSSMGGWIALLLVKRLVREEPEAARRVRAMVLVAPAWDMTERLMWQQFPDAARQALARDGVWLRPSLYGEPYPITRALIEDGRHHLLGDEAWDPGRPVHILHGLLDPDVPWEHTLDLESVLTGERVQVTAVPDGDHRLSRPEDIALLLRVIDQLAGP
jgi:pimeloyl-ACP methyl ester carboxylesterase